MTTKKKTLTARVSDLEKALEGLTNLLGGVRQDPHQLGISDFMNQKLARLDADLTSRMIDFHDNVTLRVERLEQQRRDFTQLQDAMGPLWHARSGHVRPLTMLSTKHLENILEGDFAKHHLTRSIIRGELSRREIDAEYCKKPSLLRRIVSAWKSFRRPEVQL